MKYRMRHWNFSVLCSAPTALSGSLRYTLYFPLHHYWHTHTRTQPRLQPSHTNTACNAPSLYLKDGLGRCVRPHGSVYVCLCECVISDVCWKHKIMFVRHIPGLPCKPKWSKTGKGQSKKQINDFHVSSTWQKLKLLYPHQKDGLMWMKMNAIGYNSNYEDIFHCIFSVNCFLLKRVLLPKYNCQACGWNDCDLKLFCIHSHCKLCSQWVNLESQESIYNSKHQAHQWIT